MHRYKTRAEVCRPGNKLSPFDTNPSLVAHKKAMPQPEPSFGTASSFIITTSSLLTLYHPTLRLIPDIFAMADAQRNARLTAWIREQYFSVGIN